MERIKPCVIGFSGRIKSGKTTIASAIADSLGWPCASFGDYVRRVAVQRNQDLDSRTVLQEIGESLISKGFPAFCRDVLNTVNWRSGMPIVVDGVRHVEAVKHLREIVSPLKFLLVYVAVDEDLQLARARREGLTPDMLADIEHHSTEVDVRSRLPELADLLVDGSKLVEEIVGEIREGLLRDGSGDGE